MRAISFAVVLPLIGLCYALPAQDIKPQNEGNLWPFVENLPNMTIAGDSNSSEVTLPIVPLDGVTFQTRWGYYDLPRVGAEFPADLIKAIYTFWLQSDNEPLVKISENPMIPFFRWQARFTPRFFPRTPQLLTRQKIGIAMYTVFNEVIKLDRWPGYVMVKIFQGKPLAPPQTNEIGYLEFHNQPYREDLGSASNATALGDFRTTQRWFTCFNKALQLALPKKPNGLVTNDSRFPPKPAAHKYSVRCRDSGPPDRVDLFIYPIANPGTILQLTWKDFFYALQDWLIRTAIGKDSGASVKIIKGPNRLVAEVSIYLQKGPASEQPEVATF
ncbi:MAG: hypothetical protein Q9212_001474 [Teloschistes hypoglaucus]